MYVSLIFHPVYVTTNLFTVHCLLIKVTVDLKTFFGHLVTFFSLSVAVSKIVLSYRLLCCCVLIGK